MNEVMVAASSAAMDRDAVPVYQRNNPRCLSTAVPVRLGDSLSVGENMMY